MRRKKWLRYLVLLLLVLIVVYLLGPKPATPVYNTTLPAVPAEAAALENYIRQNEAQHTLKPDNEARIVWASDSVKQPTDYAIVYLHGFSASQAEGDPVHKNIARKFGCNLYLARLAEHGIDTADAMINLTADEYWETAKQALAIGKQLGRKVILMGTSTGGTNALQLAAAYPNDVAALVLLSPNIAINNDKAYLLNNPWGLQIAKLVSGGDYNISTDTGALYHQYWYSKYHLKATVALEELLETTMTNENFKKVTQPVQLLYYYKDAVHQDSTVKVDAMLQMFDALGTPANLKRKQAIPNAGNHVIGSYIRSNDFASVQKAIEQFLTEVIGLKEMKP